MFGYGKTYADLLEIPGLDTLKTFREKALARFADNTLKNPNYSHGFPLNKERTSLRMGGKRYKEFFARTQRLYNS